MTNASELFIELFDPPPQLFIELFIELFMENVPRPRPQVLNKTWSPAVVIISRRVSFAGACGVKRNILASEMHRRSATSKIDNNVLNEYPVRHDCVERGVANHVDVIGRCRPAWIARIVRDPAHIKTEHEL